MNMNIIEILKQLIIIPSWVDEKTNEIKIGDWIFKFLKTNSDLDVKKQPIGNGRFNVTAQKGKKIDTLVTGHIDTVQPPSGWTRGPLVPEIVGNRLYGLGSTDMKSGIAIMLSLATEPRLKDNTAFLFYCDEEYDFLGMKKFIEEYKNKINLKLIISLDGEGLRIGNSCRGLIELKVKVKGIAGHSANPKSGINAITESFKVIDKLKFWIKDYKSKELGNSTPNIAYMKGGGDEGNIIADTCEYIVEIRVANQRLNAKLVSNFITKESEKLNLTVEKITVRHDLGNWITPIDKLSNIQGLPISDMKNPVESGYIDIQMLWKEFGKVPTFSFGAGETGMSHKSDEYVRISNIYKAENVFKGILCT